MNVARLLYYGLILITVVVVVVLVIGRLAAGKIARRAAQRLQALDRKYEEFVRRRISLDMLQHGDFDFDVEKLLSEARVILQPELEGLITMVHSNSAPSVRISYESKYFPNLVALAEKGLRSEKRKLSGRDAQEIHELEVALIHAIRSDLSRRKLNWQSGRL